MSTDYLDTEPRADVRTPPAPAAAPAAFVPRALGVDFTGSGSEYFRIWIVNLLLSIVSLKNQFL